MTEFKLPETISSEEELENFLSQPYESDIEFLKSLKGDILILGAGGKMGASLTWRIHRSEQKACSSCRVLAVSRFSSPGSRDWFEQRGIEARACDLLDHNQVRSLPRFENVIYLAGRKFGSSERPDLTWISNTLVPAEVAKTFAASRIVAFSTGNLYPLLPISSTGSVETDALNPVGEYAQSCLGRERMFEYYSHENGTRCLFYRLNYATDLRYGVLADIAWKVRASKPVNLSVETFNTIWQGDADSYALRSLVLCQSPPFLLNVAGPEKITLREAADFFAKRWGCEVQYEGESCGKALLSDASRCYSLLEKPRISAQQLLEWTAQWVEQGGRNLGKPTKFEVSNGRF